MASSYKSPRYKSPRKYEQELQKRLKLTTGALIATILLVFISLKYFGPKVGSIFILFSKNRTQTGPKDIIPPSAPVFSQAPTATNKDKLTLNGIAEPGATVKLFLNGPEKGKTTADNGGLFTFVDIELTKGNNILFAKATDANNNESDPSETLTIIYDDKAPEIQILEPKEGETVKNLNGRILVTGKLNEKADVKINGLNAITKPDFSFELLLGVGEGNVEIKVVATDEAGNSSEKKINVKYEKSGV